MKTVRAKIGQGQDLTPEETRVYRGIIDAARGAGIPIGTQRRDRPSRWACGARGGPIRSERRRATDMTNLLKIPTWADEENVYAIVETPRGSTCKLDFDPNLRVFTLAKPLMAGTYPYGIHPDRLCGTDLRGGM